MSLGLFAFSVLGGVVADRFSKRRIIISVQGCTAAVMATVAVLSLTGSIELWHVGVASFAMGAGSAFFHPAYSAYLPQVLPPEQLLAANGLEGALRPSMGQGLGPALGGVIVGAFFPAIGAALPHWGADCGNHRAARAVAGGAEADAHRDAGPAREDVAPFCHFLNEADFLAFRDYSAIDG